MAINTFLRYVDKDKGIVEELKKHLSTLIHSNRIKILDEKDISPGAASEQEIESMRDRAQMILLFISSDFIASDYLYGEALQHAIEQHEHQKKRAIPILLRQTYLKDTPLDKLQMLPDDGKPISPRRSRDEGYTNVVNGIVKVLDEWESLPGPTEERKTMIDNLDKLIAFVKAHMQPEERANPTASTLEQLSVYIPVDVTLADLNLGWRVLSQPIQEHEDIAIEKRRITCGELADLSAPLATGQGDLQQAIKTWRAWAKMFTSRNDPRQEAMTRTFTRELAELEQAAH